MKYLSLFFTLLFVTSCNGYTKVSDNSPTGKDSIEVTSNEVANTNELETSLNTNDINNTAAEVRLQFDHHQWNTLLSRHVSNNGNVNYKGFKRDIVLLQNYIGTLSENMPNETWSKEAKLAYWINAYNALTVDLIVKNYPIKSIKDIDNPWGQRLWNLGGTLYNLDEIEHKILRKMDDPRIHFGIVCASFSCPKLLNTAFTAEQLDEQLTTATRDFLSDTDRNNISENELNLSKIFQWFAKDFKQNGTLIDFIDQYSDINISPNAKKRYKDYNWALNE